MSTIEGVNSTTIEEKLESTEETNSVINTTESTTTESTTTTTATNTDLTDIQKEIIMNKLGGFEFFEKVLKSPKKIVAPMVEHTYLAFRMLCRKYGADLVYTPMFHSKNFATQKHYRRDNFSTCPGDRPLVVQFCGNEPEWVVKAAKFVENDCDAIDLNLGCPQMIAKRGNYGSFLLDKPHIILPIVRELHKNIKVPIFCKIRLLPSIEDTIKLAKDLQEAGCQLLTVHGRTKEQKGHNAPHANWDAIRQIKEALTIPVIANGSVVEYGDIEPCLEQSHANGVMSAEGILKNPAMFCGYPVDTIQLSKEYLELCKVYPTDIGCARSHLFKMLKDKFDLQADLRDNLHIIKDFDGLIKIIDELDHRIKTNAPPNKCLTNKEKRKLEDESKQAQPDGANKEVDESDHQSKKLKLDSPLTSTTTSATTTSTTAETVTITASQ